MSLPSRSGAAILEYTGLISSFRQPEFIKTANTIPDKTETTNRGVRALSYFLDHLMVINDLSSRSQYVNSGWWNWSFCVPSLSRYSYAEQ
jgi:hypothetical protein